MTTELDAQFEAILASGQAALDKTRGVFPSQVPATASPRLGRYHLIEVGCLECSFDGDSGPVIVMTTDNLEEPELRMNETKYSHEVDRFIFDSETGQVITCKRV